jgi:4a-hydroxytetrahydrobiopterin dehydratase
MTDLSKLKCEACRADAPKVNEADIPDLLKEIPQWQVRRPENIPQLFRAYEFKNFKEAWAFSDKVAALAEEEFHHPDILLEWGRVSISWWIHKIKGLHKNDFICAAKTDALYQG